VIEVPVNVDTTELQARLDQEIARFDTEYRSILLGVRQVLGAAEGTEVDLVAGVRALADEVARLTPLAKDGETYRTNLIKDALEEGVRAFGNTFAREMYETTFKNADIAFVRQMHDDWKRFGDGKIPTGPQIRGDEDETQAPSATNPARYHA